MRALQASKELKCEAKALCNAFHGRVLLLSYDITRWFHERLHRSRYVSGDIAATLLIRDIQKELIRAVLWPGQSIVAQIVACNSATAVVTVVSVFHVELV